MQINELLKKISEIPRINLVNLPTPLQAMPRLSKILNGPRLWVKRDDCTGLAFGGNKERKMEFAMADVLSQRADVVITTGPIQSNHSRTTAAAAKKLGLKAILVLRGKKPKNYSGNLLLDYLLDADIRFVQVGSQSRSIMEEIAEEVKKDGHVPYIIPGGASYPVGAVAYVNAMVELLTQAKEIGIKIDYLVHAAGSGGTQAGLVLGNKILRAKVKILGMCVEPDNVHLAKRTVEIACGAAKVLGLEETVDMSDVVLVEDYVGEGYGVLTKEVTEAIKLVAQTEGILLDPVYTGKAMAGLVNMIKQKRFEKNDNIVFIHTGGTPALFVYDTKIRSLY